MTVALGGMLLIGATGPAVTGLAVCGLGIANAVPLLVGAAGARSARSVTSPPSRWAARASSWSAADRSSRRSVGLPIGFALLVVAALAVAAFGGRATAAATTSSPRRRSADRVAGARGCDPLCRGAKAISQCGCAARPGSPARPATFRLVADLRTSRSGTPVSKRRVVQRRADRAGLGFSIVDGNGRRVMIAGLRTAATARVQAGGRPDVTIAYTLSPTADGRSWRATSTFDRQEL